MNPNCPPCKELKKALIQEDISFTERDIVNDLSAAQEFRQLGGQYTPTTIVMVGDERHEVIGANINKIKSILETSTL
ncbi:glutaredoxin family protein [Mesobacillus boroniphilus]|uniref:glutaredoxin family protein n=1 Tax=Mesobacillus boroniphilus TaxID=308892 RepID=UPI00054D8A35|nr:glutaredoxin domain-containing protein [Mesobacillus boroniphilus]